MKIQSSILRPSRADGTATPGTSIYGSATFASPRVGFALGRYPARSYSFFPVRTTNGGRRWRIIGPAVSQPVAHGAINVSAAGVAGRRTYFLWGAGANAVVDLTANRGRTWRQVLFKGGTVLSVTPQLSDSGLGGVIEVLVSSGSGCATNGRCRLSSYSSRNGKRWRRTSG